MSGRTSGLAPLLVTLVCTGGILWADSDKDGPGVPPSEDRPKVAIVQYESGRVLVAREVNGELLVIEPNGSNAEILDRYLIDRQVARAVHNVNQPLSARAAEPLEADPMFYSPDWFYGHAVINTDPPTAASPPGIALERFKQNAAELRQQVKVRRQEQGTTGVTNRAGRVYPSTAADHEENDRLARTQDQVGASPDVTFYSLGGGLEYFRQQELAARHELALLTYDVLLEEGLQSFHNRRYGQAARSFIAATQKDQGDPGSRLYAAQCLMAAGLYRPALAHVRRAFELAPQLAYRPLNHRDNYSHPQDFDRQLAVLKAHVADHPDDDDAVLLLAFEQFFSDRPAQATAAMKRVAVLAETDQFALRLWRASEPVLGHPDSD